MSGSFFRGYMYGVAKGHAIAALLMLVASLVCAVSGLLAPAMSFAVFAVAYAGVAFMARRELKRWER